MSKSQGAARPRLLLGRGFLLALLLGSPATADWLVTRDGATLETRGPWRVEGRLVVFTANNGILSSLRLEDLDLEASRSRDELAEHRPAAEPSTSRSAEPVLVLTDDDVAHVGSETDDVAPAPSEEANTGGLRVAEWSQRLAPEIEGLVIDGTIENAGKQPAEGVVAVALLYGPNGQLVGTARAELAVIEPEERSSFQMELRGLSGFHHLEFNLSSQSGGGAGDSTGGNAE